MLSNTYMSNTYSICNNSFSRKDHPCIRDETVVPLGKVKSQNRSNAIMTIEQCYNDFIQRSLNCSLPWRKYNQCTYLFL